RQNGPSLRGRPERPSRASPGVR
ncbi:hypothetical protein BN1723_019222, partial [Verticillium longisporum]